MSLMTPEVLKDACKKNGGFAQPALNDQLFLQCRGFSKIANLEPYVNLKVLWLEQNGLTVIEGLETCSKLVSLFLQNNAINRLGSGLHGLSNLRILNLSNNYISSLTGLAAGCPLLETLQISHNQLPSLKACEELWQLADTLSSVDLSFNKLDRGNEGVDGDSTTASGALAAPPLQQADLTIVSFFVKLPNVSVIYLHGNPLSHGMKGYRKNMVLHLKQLTYLDERPVFPEERRTTEAWGRGGDKAETEERLKIKSEKRQELTSCVETMAKAMEANRETRDRLSKQWEEQRELEREELRLRRMEMKKRVQVVDSMEYDARSGIEIEEGDAWFELEQDILTVYEEEEKQEAVRRKAFLQAEEVETLRKEVDKELQVQESRIAEVLETVGALSPSAATPTASSETVAVATPAATEDVLQRTKARETMEYWIRQLDATDDEVLTEMESDLQKFLKDLEPTLPSTRIPASDDVVDVAMYEKHRSAGNEVVTTSSSRKYTTGKSNATLTRSVTQAVAVTSASLREGKSASSIVQSREAMWESYYSWETRNRK